MSICPKNKSSKARRDKRRSNVWKMDAPELVKWPAVRGVQETPHEYAPSAAITTASK